MTVVEPSGTEAGGASIRVRLLARIGGRVQGVGYRAFVVARASDLGLDGWVRNLPTGDVDLEAEGPRPKVIELLRDLKVGPPASRVHDLHAEWAPVRGYRGFEIRRI
jgi:acylphosphatase